MNFFRKLFGKYIPDPDRDVEELQSGNVSDRAGAAHLLKVAAEEGDLRPEHIPPVARALQREGESLITLKFLMEILSAFPDHDRAVAGVEAYLARKSRLVLTEEHTSLNKSAILELEQMIDITPTQTAGGRLLQLALRRMVLDSNVRDRYRFRCFRVLHFSRRGQV